MVMVFYLVGRRHHYYALYSGLPYIGPLLRWTGFGHRVLNSMVLLKIFGPTSYDCVLVLFFNWAFFTSMLWVSRQNTSNSVLNLNLNDIGTGHEQRSKSSLAAYSLLYDIPSVIWWSFSIIRYLCIAWHRIQSDGHGGEWGNEGNPCLVILKDKTVNERIIRAIIKGTFLSFLNFFLMIRIAGDII